ncbi:hypothetical protein DFH06DRAFT_314479 [Mycena polygramma]|nr:hypothetical protein DFH06DRAFT_314479 [Mycena polygramma]
MSDASSLTEMSQSEDEEDIEMKDPPPISAQKAYDYLVPLIGKFNATVENITLPEQLRTSYAEATSSLISKARQKDYKIAIVGRTGAGKSTLLNALLERQVLTASASGACTAVTTEISYKDVKHTEAVVEFITRDEWKKILSHLIEDVVDTTVDTQEATDTSFSSAYQAKAKVLGVYPQLQGLDEKQWRLEELLDDPLISQHLGQARVFTASGNESGFQKELEQFLASTLTTSDTRALWPLVKIVKIMGRFEVLSTGVTLVDLPGHGDADSVRDGMANAYLKTADTICLVANIARAKDDKDLHLYLHRKLSQIILDGRVKEKSVLLILTGADQSIGSNEITLEPKQQAIVNTLKEEAISLVNDIQVLQTKMEKKEQSKAKKKAEQIEKLKDQIGKKRLLKESRVREKNRLLALGRSKIVEKSLKEKCEHLFQEISQEKDAVPDIPIFCLGSRDYLCLANLEPDPSAIFTDKEETGIPRLRRYFERDGERRNLVDAREAVTTFCDLLARTTQPYSGTVGCADSTLEIHAKINALETICGTKVDELIDKMRTDYNALLLVVEKAVDEAEKNSPAIFESHTSKKWNQYRAMMRQEGQYEGGNLNTDLTKTILPAIQQKWYDVVNTKIPHHLDDFMDQIKEELTDTVKSILTDTPQHKAGNMRKALAIESFLTELKLANGQFTRSAQRSGTRAWEPLVKRELDPQYTKVCAEKGPGMYKRMKLASQVPVGSQGARAYAISVDEQSIHPRQRSGNIQPYQRHRHAIV